MDGCRGLGMAIRGVGKRWHGEGVLNYGESKKEKGGRVNGYRFSCADDLRLCRKFYMWLCRVYVQWMGGFDHERWRLFTDHCSLVVLPFSFCRRDGMGYRGESIRLDDVLYKGVSVEGSRSRSSMDRMISNGNNGARRCSCSWFNRGGLMQSVVVWFGESERVVD